MMITQNWLISVFISSWRMRKSRRNEVIKSNWLEAYWCVLVNLSYGLWKFIIKLLEFDSLSHRWNYQSWISPKISNKWLINQFISYDIRVSHKSFCKFFPESIEFFIQFMIDIVKIIEALTNIITEIIFSPSISVTVIPVWKSCFVKLNFFTHWERESFISF